MPKTNVPYWYGIVDTAANPVQVHLYLLVYATSATISDDGSSGQTKKFAVASSGTGTAEHTAHFSFARGSFDTIQISFNFEGAENKLVKIVMADLDTTATQTLPVLSGNLALDTPYEFTFILPNTTNKFDAEMVIRVASPGKSFSASQSGPNQDKDTFSAITSAASGVTQTEFSVTHHFTVDQVAAQDGGHTVAYNGGKKGKTKNKYHTTIPFPRPRLKKA